MTGHPNTEPNTCTTRRGHTPAQPKDPPMPDNNPRPDDRHGDFLSWPTLDVDEDGNPTGATVRHYRLAPSTSTYIRNHLATRKDQHHD